LLLTRGRALAYATQRSPWTPIEHACTPDATCSHGQSACGAMLDASGGGGAVTVFVARHASGPTGVVQVCPGVHAVDGGTKEREEGRDGGVWSKGPEDRTRQRGAVQDNGQRYTKGVPGSVAWTSLALCTYVVYRKRQYHTRQNLPSTVLAHAGYFMFGCWRLQKASIGRAIRTGAVFAQSEPG
jgi:hypothetical protein